MFYCYPLTNAYCYNCRFNTKNRKGMSKEKIEHEKLVYKHKKEMKGALREIRRDSSFIGAYKLKDKLHRLGILIITTNKTSCTKRRIILSISSFPLDHPSLLYINTRAVYTS